MRYTDETEFTGPEIIEKCKTINLDRGVDEKEIEELNEKNKHLKGKKAAGTLYTMDGLRADFEDDIMYESVIETKKKKIAEAVAIINQKQK